MSEDYRELQIRLNRMTQRKEILLQIISEMEIDMQAMKLQLSALNYEGDSEDRP